MLTPQQQIYERQRKRNQAFGMDAAALKGQPPSEAFLGRQRQFGIDEAEDSRAINDLNNADRQKNWADSVNTVGPDSVTANFGPSRTQPNAPVTQPQEAQGGGLSRAATMGWQNPLNPSYVEAQPMPSRAPTTRNNFSGAENAPEGSVVRGIDKLLYRRTGGEFVRVPVNNANVGFDGPASMAIASQKTRFDSDVANFGLPIAQRNRQNAGLNGPTASVANDQPQQFPDSTAAGLANKAKLTDRLAAQDYEFGVKQDAERDARVRGAATSAGAYRDMNRHSPRFGSTINWFDPGSVNPDSLSKPRKKPVPTGVY